MDFFTKVCSLKKHFPPSEISLPAGGFSVLSNTYHPAGMQEEPISIDSDETDFVWNPNHVTIQGIIHPVDPAAPGIRFEFSTPENWNGKLVQMGGGGFCGFVSPTNLFEQGASFNNRTMLSRGYAVCSCDSGHILDMKKGIWAGAWALNDEALDDFTHGQVKKTKDCAVAILKELFDCAPTRVYFSGGSEGGREAMCAMQRYPDDYDGILCFYPAINWIGKAIMESHWADIQIRAGGAAALANRERLYVRNTVMDLCDEDDGIKDGIVANWEKAREKKSNVLKSLRKHLSKPQVDFLDALSTRYVFPYPLANGWQKAFAHPFEFGGPLDYFFSNISGHYDMMMMQFGDGIIRYMIMRDETFDPREFDVVENRGKILARSHAMEMTDQHIERFKNKGGKLLLLHGLADGLVTPFSSIEYYHSLKNVFHNQLDDFVRFYLVPGYGHGTGDFIVDYPFLDVLDTWVETGYGPDEIVVKDSNPQTKGRMRPIYPYPDYAEYVDGDQNQANSFRRSSL